MKLGLALCFGNLCFNSFDKWHGLALCFGNLCFNSFNKWHLTILPRGLCFLRPSFLRMAGNNAVGVLTVCFCRRGSTVTYDLIRVKPSDRLVLLHEVWSLPCRFDLSPPVSAPFISLWHPVCHELHSFLRKNALNEIGIALYFYNIDFDQDEG